MFKRFLGKIDEISLKSFVSYSLMIALVVAIPLSVYISKQETSYQAGATLDKYPSLAVDEDSIPYPTNAPTITKVEKPYGKIGDSILIYGTNFGEAQKESFVEIGGVTLNRENTPFWSDTQIEAKIPEGAQNGLVSVTINGKSARWSEVLTIIR
ncbi:IPT/TIG domain-containing protein [Candidatus Parcubacteria bacterium]|nr:IPT/TIG domain-containing protein [Patescibacteria group bacterium]MBU4381009.1 IPT/TIG domain-containing protein [Patescibacteria group bacterium]MCG2689320.1 IPT/TIG domain-containing protein [Candidatus Parcubacteria bacterium]